MPQASGDTRQRFPNLSKLGIAIVEHLVEKTIGDAAVEEVKRPYTEKQIENSLGQALQQVEADFIDQYHDQDARDVLLQLPIHDLPSVLDALWAFYKRPNSHRFSDLLVEQLKAVRGLSEEQVNSAVDFYLSLLRHELINVNPEIRDKLQASAAIKTEELLIEIRDGLKAQAGASSSKVERAKPQVNTQRGQKEEQALTTILPPPFTWIHIPAGTIILGGNDGANGGYVTRATIFEVSDFDIAKYPITNLQFQVFVDDADGYHKLARWDFSPDAQTWYQRNRKPHVVDSKSLPNHPRVDVCWYEAVAFCLWLKEKTGEDILLPTDQQWQRAAQGDTKWAYPYGNRFYKSRCNFNSSGTTEVTQYEGKGDSPFGVVDMSGNVWEWCLTNYGIGNHDIAMSAQYRVLRGGSWRNRVEDWLRTDRRNYKNPGVRYNNKGFRLVRN